MPDRSLRIVENNQGEITSIEKTIGDIILTFKFSAKENRAILTNKFKFSDRLYSSSELWVPKPLFIAACRQASAIFIQRHKALVAQV